ncbi:hypothetical protein J6590_024911 [Homalodisca vitripennis]|nr:hypothetical protein J6590_024911 [Homalodisca vitripennis]
MVKLGLCLSWRRVMWVTIGHRAQHMAPGRPLKLGIRIDFQEQYSPILPSHRFSDSFLVAKRVCRESSLYLDPR